MERARNAEVREQQPPIRMQQQVRGLHVTVDDARLMRVVERGGGLFQIQDGLRNAKRTLARQQRAERAIGEVGHDDIGDLALARLFHAEFVNGDDVGVIERGGGVGLTMETRQVAPMLLGWARWRRAAA